MVLIHPLLMHPTWGRIDSGVDTTTRWMLGGTSAIVSTKIVIIPVWWMIVSHTRLAHWLKILDPKKQQNQHGLIIIIQIATVHNVAKFIGQLLPSSAIMTTEHAKAGAFNGTTDTCDVSGSINVYIYIYYIYILYILHNHIAQWIQAKTWKIHPFFVKWLFNFNAHLMTGDFPAMSDIHTIWSTLVTGWGSDEQIRKNWLNRSILEIGKSMKILENGHQNVKHLWSCLFQDLANHTANRVG